MSLLLQSSWAAAAALTAAASRFALTTILARRLSEGPFGQFAYGFWLVNLVFLVCSLGASGATSRYFAQYHSDAPLLSAVARRWQAYALGLSGLTGASVLVAARVSGMELSASTAALLAAWAITNGLWAMQNAALSGLQRFDLVFKGNLAFAVVVLGGLSLGWSQEDSLATVYGLAALGSITATSVGIRGTLRLAGTRSTPGVAPPWSQIHSFAGNAWVSAIVANLVWSRGELPIVRGLG